MFKGNDTQRKESWYAGVKQKHNSEFHYIWLQTTFKSSVMFHKWDWLKTCHYQLANF